MIRFLSIQNLGVVEKVELELQPGLTVLTGETGAGKSIVLGALGLLVGARATTGLVRTGTSKAVVQAAVETSDGQEVILRREITEQGRSRTFIDDTLATGAAVQAIGRQAISLHGQNEQQGLRDSRAHLRLIDTFGNLANDIGSQVSEQYRIWQKARRTVENLLVNEQEEADRQDLLTFQSNEIDRVSPNIGEDESLSVTRNQLANAERLAQLCGEAYGRLYEQDDAVLEGLGQVWRRIEELVSLDPEFAEHLEVRRVVEPSLEELAFFLRSYGTKIEVSPDRLAEAEGRLADLEQLKQKYGPTLKEVLQHRQEIDVKLMNAEENHKKRGVLEARATLARKRYYDLAKKLSGLRHQAAVKLSRGLIPILANLAIPEARFETRFKESPVEEKYWSEEGIDAGEFFFSANPGERVKPLSKVASGGELSRVMLGIKTLTSTDQEGKTLVFDEVDAGIGGVVADRVGLMLRGLAEKYQVLCVTHLPQIAVYAVNHHRVSKAVKNSRTTTEIDRLREKGRVAEIARLMTGEENEHAMVIAEKLLESKQKAKGESETAKAKGRQ